MPVDTAALMAALRKGPWSPSAPPARQVDAPRSPSRELAEAFQSRRQALSEREHQLREAAARLAVPPAPRSRDDAASNGNGHVPEAAHAVSNGYPAAKGNGHAGSNGNGQNGNGLAGANGNGRAAALAVSQTEAPDQERLSAAMSELRSHLDETVGLIRSMRPGKERRL